MPLAYEQIWLINHHNFNNLNGFISRRNCFYSADINTTIHTIEIPANFIIDHTITRSGKGGNQISGQIEYLQYTENQQSKKQSGGLLARLLR